jgi:hypothetical protein
MFLCTYAPIAAIAAIAAVDAIAVITAIAAMLMRCCARQGTSACNEPKPSFH